MLKVLCVLWRKAADILNVSLLYALLMKSHASGVGSLEFCCRHCFILNFHIMCIYILSIVLSFNLFSTFSTVILTPVSAYWRLEQVWKLLGLDVAAVKLIESLVFSRLDYCNAILASLLRSNIAPLQWVQNAAAHLVAHLGPRDHVTPTPKDHHWLPIKQWITSQLCLLMHQVHTRRAPSYRHSCVTASADITSRPRLRSTSARVWSLENVHFHVPDQELGTVCYHHCMNSLTLRLSNVNWKHFFFNRRTSRCHTYVSYA